MPDRIEIRLARLEAEQAAVRDVLLSSLIAIDRRADGFGRAVIAQAQAIADVSVQDRPVAEIAAIALLLDELRIAIDAPAND